MTMGVVLIILVKLFAVGCGVVIVLRAVNVLRKMDMAARKEHYLAWAAFGFSYALLTVAALGACLAVVEGPVDFRDLTWLLASAGLILFDRRRRRPVQPRSTATAETAGA